jgi:quercetin dioxygenase-like cupin family protein
VTTTVTYGKGFEVDKPQSLAERVATLQDEISKYPQYEPPTENVFHGGMYCRQVWRPAGCLIVGKVHKKEHFYMIVSGTVKVTTDDGVQTITGPMLLCSKPGTKRAVYAETDAMCMTFHRVESNTVEEVESELVEDDPNSMFTIGNKVKNQQIEVKP